MSLDVFSPDEVYMDEDGYIAPGYWLLPGLSIALEKVQEAEMKAYSALGNYARWHYQLGQKKAEQDRSNLWPDISDPAVQRFEKIRLARMELEHCFRELATEGKPPNLKLARHRTTLEQQEADLER